MLYEILLCDISPSVISWKVIEVSMVDGERQSKPIIAICSNMEKLTHLSWSNVSHGIIDLIPNIWISHQELGLISTGAVDKGILISSSSLPGLVDIS